MKKILLFLCLFAFIVSAKASTIDSQKALSLVKELRGDAANKNVDFYIGTVKNCFNEWYCPIDSTELNEQKWLNDGQDKWLVFVNEEPKMAWSHKCTYYYLPKSIKDGNNNDTANRLLNNNIKNKYHYESV